MAKTVAELSALCASLQARLQAADELAVNLDAQVGRLAELLHAERATAAGQREALADARRRTDDLLERDERRREEVAALQLEAAVLRQRLDDHLKRVELWDARRWGLVVAVVLAVFGAALSFASGLLLATLRKTP